MTPPTGAPEVTDDMRASARANPNTWLYVLDPAFVGAADVPQWAIVGAYPVNADGQIEDRFAPNDTYRPSPTALGWPAPLTELEKLIQLAKAGHRPVTDLPAAVLDATLLVFDPGDGTWQGTPLIALPDGQTGRLVVPACTSPEHVPSDWLAWRAMRGDEIVPLLRGYPLAINPDGPVSAILPAELLTESAKDVHRPDDGDVLHGRHHAG
ncbi:MAG TPA: type VII secretion system-associated protein [Pseudonocardiaceae bacterium]|nr:type VII secretion system-associated protein [Pseudonocardiaceae bacterium]